MLDTNAVLDWLVFLDPCADALAAAIESGQVRWLASAAMRAELDSVLQRGTLGVTRFDPTDVLSSFDRLARPCIDPPAGWLRCRDPSDQVFLDLALSADCTWLITKDRALLALARRTRPRGLLILPPQSWPGHPDRR